MGALQRERLFQHIGNFYGAEPEYLWAKYPSYAVFRHPASRKWYAAILDIPKSKLGMPEDTYVDILDIKCDPVLVGSLLAEDGFFPAYHMNKKSWITILLDETVPDEKIFSLLEMSYDSVAPKRKQKKRDTV